VPEVSERSGEISIPPGAHAGLPVFWREAAFDPVHEETPATGACAGVRDVSKRGGPGAPLYLHGVPTSSDDWVEFLARGGGIAPDLPGFGRSGKPGSLRFTIDEYADFIESFLDLVGIERDSLVMHDWGALGLMFARRHPERIDRLVLINAVPFLPGYRWHRTARIWRTPVLGELSMGSIGPRALRLLSKEANAAPGPMPDSWQQSVLAHFDQGTQRAILRLYRSSPPEVLAAAGARLGELRVPSLVVWGVRDPYIPARFGRAYAELLGAELVELEDAGHWPWLDRPDMIDRVAAFLSAG
jgi:pimeloyl-ACP methyl ester carboxylesterase